MALALQTRIAPRCPRCAGPLYPDYQDAYGCLFCGEYVFFDAQGQRMTPVEEELPAGPPRRRRRAAPAA
jgi:hypothetical protein